MITAERARELQRIANEGQPVLPSLIEHIDRQIAHAAKEGSVIAKNVLKGARMAFSYKQFQGILDHYNELGFTTKQHMGRLNILWDE